MKRNKRWHAFTRLLFIISILILPACSQQQENESESLVIAAATSFEPILEEIGELFSTETGIPVTFVYGAKRRPESTTF